MKSYKEFNIRTTTKTFTGEKIKAAKILNKPIEVYGYDIQPSIYENKGDCLYLQIKLNGEDRLVFSGSKYLIEAIKQIPEDGFPFATTIVEIDDRHEFS